MKFKTVDDTYILRIEKGEDIKKVILDFAKKEGVNRAYFMGIGALESAEIAFYDQKTKKYLRKKIQKPTEVVSFLGNITLLDKKPVIHAHISLADKKFKNYSGHFVKGTASVGLEIFLVKLKAKIKRKLDPKFNLNLLEL